MNQLDESIALAQFKPKPKPIESKSLSEDDALSQFITIPDSEKCGKCGRRIITSSQLYPDKYFDAPWEKPQIEICETCFDGMIKKNSGFY